MNPKFKTEIPWRNACLSGSLRFFALIGCVSHFATPLQSATADDHPNAAVPGEGCFYGIVASELRACEF